MAFYEALGLERHEKFTEGVAFFQMGGVILSLFPREELAKDTGLEAMSMEAAGSGGYAGRSMRAPDVALAYNTRLETEVAELLERAKAAGGRIVKPAGRAFWGGVQGYFADTEGNIWEVAHNPDFPIDGDGRISLPE